MRLRNINHQIYGFNQKIEQQTLKNMENCNLKDDVMAVKFIEWVVELLPPEYDMDIRHRFSPQVKLPGENELLWIETHKFSGDSPKFYTTKEIYELWLANYQ